MSLIRWNPVQVQLIWVFTSLPSTSQKCWKSQSQFTSLNKKDQFTIEEKSMSKKNLQKCDTTERNIFYYSVFPPVNLFYIHLTSSKHAVQPVNSSFQMFYTAQRNHLIVLRINTSRFFLITCFSSDRQKSFCSSQTQKALRKTLCPHWCWLDSSKQVQHGKLTLRRWCWFHLLRPSTLSGVWLTVWFQEQKKSKKKFEKQQQQQLCPDTVFQQWTVVF